MSIKKCSTIFIILLQIYLDFVVFSVVQYKSRLFVVQNREEMNKEEYAANWEEISFGIKMINKFRCEVCGIDFSKNESDFRHIYKYSNKKELDDWENTGNLILTVHHLDMNKTNNFYLNLLCCCNACHLRIQKTFVKDQLFIFKDLVPEWVKYHYPKNNE